MALPSYFLSLPLTGTNGRNNDGIDPTEILNYLFKKSFGIPNTKLINAYNADSPESFNSAIRVNNTNIYSQYIPPSISITISLIQIINWVNPNGGSGNKYIHPNYPYLAYYQNILMSPTDSVIDSSFFCGIYTDTSTNFSKNSIPHYFGDGV